MNGEFPRFFLSLEYRITMKVSTMIEVFLRKFENFEVCRHIPIDIHIVRRAIVKYVKLDILPSVSRKVLSYNSANVIK